MADASQHHQLQALKSIDNSLKQLVRVMTTINENLVTVGKTLPTKAEQGEPNARSAE